VVVLASASGAELLPPPLLHAPSNTVAAMDSVDEIFFKCVMESVFLVARLRLYSLVGSR